MWRVTVTAVLLAVGVAVTGCSASPDIGSTPGGGTSTLSATPDGSQSGDYFTPAGVAQVTHPDAKRGIITYCPVDGQGRATCAYGLLTSTLRKQAQARGRQPLDVDPAGWPATNPKVTIRALPEVAGSKSYTGWMWNRSHMVGDSLGGDAVSTNLVAGTRTQNVGSVQQDGQYAGGMAHTELMARTYLDSADRDSCPLYYAVTPMYSGAEKIPRTVTVDIRSCDATIDQHVVVPNTANGWMINYTTGTAIKVG